MAKSIEKWEVYNYKPEWRSYLAVAQSPNSSFLAFRLSSCFFLSFSSSVLFYLCFTLFANKMFSRLLLLSLPFYDHICVTHFCFDFFVFLAAPWAASAEKIVALFPPNFCFLIVPPCCRVCNAPLCPLCLVVQASGVSEAFGEKGKMRKKQSGKGIWDILLMETIQQAWLTYVGYS